MTENEKLARLNVICSKAELDQWKTRARRRKFKTLSDYVRAALNAPDRSGLTVLERQTLRKILQVIEHGSQD